MNPDQIAPFEAVWSGFIVLAVMVKSSLMCIWIHEAKVKSTQYVHGKISLAG